MSDTSHDGDRVTRSDAWCGISGRQAELSQARYTEEEAEIRHESRPHDFRNKKGTVGAPSLAGFRNEEGHRRASLREVPGNDQRRIPPFGGHYGGCREVTDQMENMSQNDR